MNTLKLKEALVEIQAQRNVVDAAITQIQNVLAMLGGVREQTIPLTGIASAVTRDSRSYIDDAVQVLEMAGQPLHVKEIVKKVSELRGTEVTRPSVESSLIRHISKTTSPRLNKIKPSVYGLPIWKTPTLFSAPEQRAS